METDPQTVLDLGPGPLSHILKFLTIKDIQNAAITCRAFRDASKHDAVWEAKAKERFPPETAHLGDTYSTWRALTADDNAAHASLVLPLKQISSDYKHNRPDYFFECCIMDLQLNRATGALRVFFDARGEADLRNPLTASLGVTVHRAHTNRRELRSILAQLSQRRTELLEEADRLEPLITQDPEAANLHHRTLRELHLAMLRTVRAHQELQEAPYIGFADLLTVLRPSKHEFFVQKPGHFKGYLEFENIAQIEALADSLPHSYRLKHEVERCGVDLVFCYANPVPVMPHPHMVDYHPVQLIEVPPGMTLEQVMRERGVYAAHDAHARAMREEGEEEDARRWAHVEPELRQRRADLPGWRV